MRARYCLRRVIGAAGIAAVVCAFFASAAFAVDLKDKYGPLLDPHRMQIFVEGSLDYSVNDLDYLRERAAGITRYDYHYEYPMWDVDAGGYYGLPGNWELFAARYQGIPYEYGYNASTYNSALAPTAYQHDAYRVKQVAESTTEVSVTKRNADQSVEIRLAGQWFEDFWTDDHDLTNNATSSYYDATKTESSYANVILRTRYITNATPTMQYIRSDLDGRFFPLLDRNQQEGSFELWYQNYADAQSTIVTTRTHYNRPATEDYRETTKRALNQGVGRFICYGTLGWGLTDTVELYCTAQYFPVRVANDESESDYRIDTDLHTYVLTDTYYHFVGYIQPTLRMRMTENTEALISGYCNRSDSTLKYDYKTTTAVVNNITSRRIDTVAYTTYIAVDFRYMSEVAGGKNTPYNGSNLDSRLRPLLDRRQVLFETGTTLNAYFEDEKDVVCVGTRRDLHTVYSYYSFDVDTNFGYGITDKLQITGGPGLRFPFDSNIPEYKVGGTAVSYRYHYWTLVSGDVELIYRPREDRQLYVRGAYVPSTSILQNRVTTQINNSNDSIRTRTAQASYEVIFGANLLF